MTRFSYLRVSGCHTSVTFVTLCIAGQMSQYDMGRAFFGKVFAKGIQAPGSESEAGLGSESGQAWVAPAAGCGAGFGWEGWAGAGWRGCWARGCDCEWVTFFENPCHLRSFPALSGGCVGGVWDLVRYGLVGGTSVWYISSNELARGECRGQRRWVVGGA